VEPYFVSFHPGIPLDLNLPVFSPVDQPEIRTLLQGATGVLLPSYVTPQRYSMITRWCRSWFPRLDTRFRNCGKTAQIELFRSQGVRHPESVIFENAQELGSHAAHADPPGGYPCVLKGDTGGGGSTVFPVRDREELMRCVQRLPSDRPMLLQRWVNHGGMDLRVVVYGKQTVSYFRIGDGQFYNNVCRGGRLDHDGRPELQQKGIEAVRAFCDSVAIDIAGFDLMFPDSGPPVFVEINFHFGRKGLGGSPGHRLFWARAVQEWQASCLERVPPSPTEVS
jgi:ribosomal protein S6--L-glutamate ligase